VYEIQKKKYLGHLTSGGECLVEECFVALVNSIYVKHLMLNYLVRGFTDAIEGCFDIQIYLEAESFTCLAYYHCGFIWKAAFVTENDEIGLLDGIQRTTAFIESRVECHSSILKDSRTNEYGR
jgi:hypothetical protein